MANKFSTKKNEGVTASSLFALDSKSGHSKIYDELCDIVDRVSYSGVLNAEDATDEYPDAVDVEFEVTSEDSAPYSVMVYIYGKEENDEESQLSYSVHDEYNNNLKDYISAVQGAPLGYQKGYKISELSQMWDDIEKDIQTLVSNADTDESKQKEAKKHTCSMQKKKESLAKKSEATYNPDKVKADEWRLDYLSGVDDFYEGVKKYGFDLDDNGYWGSGKDGVYYRTIWLKNGKRTSGPNTNHIVKIGYDTNENTPFVAIDQYVLGNVQDLLTVIADNFAPKTMESLAKKSEAKKPSCSMQKKKEALAKKQEANSEEYITEWQADIIKGLEKVKDEYGLVIEYNGPFSDEWKEYPTYSVFVRKGGKKEDVGTVGTDYVHAFVDYANPGMNVSRPHKAKDYSAEEAIQVILNSAKMCLGKKGESKKQEADGEDSQATYAVCFDYVQTMCKSVKANSVEDAVEKARQTISKDMQVCEIWCNEKTLPNGTKVYLDGKDSDEQSYTEGGWGVV